MFKLEDYYPINEEEVREAWGHQINGLAQEYYDYYEVEKNIEYVNSTRKYKENAKIFT